MRVRVASLNELRNGDCVTVKVDRHPICLVLDGSAVRAVDDRCPHMGFPLHRGSVEAGMLTCHWHHARFDLASGGTLDPFADDVRVYPVEVDGDDVYVVAEDAAVDVGYLERRLRDGLEQGLTLVIAKAVLALLDAGVSVPDITRLGVEFGTEYRGRGWGSGLTVLVAMARLAPLLDPDDRPAALVHGLAFVSRDTRGDAPWFPLAPLGPGLTSSRRAQWYRRTLGTRGSDAAERILAGALAAGDDRDVVAPMMFAAVTDHVFVDGGHTLDFTNKAFEALGLLGWTAAAQVLPTVVRGTALAQWSEQSGPWRYPQDLAALVRDAEERLPDLMVRAASGPRWSIADLRDLAEALLGDDPTAVIATLDDAIVAGASSEELGRALALAAALRLVRFHIQNDHGDWDAVHHSFTAAHALHTALARAPSVELARGLYHGAMAIYLDRFLNVPAARPPGREPVADLDAALAPCWESQGEVDRAGNVVHGYLSDGGDRDRVIAALGHALLVEDAEFHWFQSLEAATFESRWWPVGSEESALVLTGAARFLAAHTPTRRESARVLEIAARLRRGEAVFEG